MRQPTLPAVPPPTPEERLILALAGTAVTRHARRDEACAAAEHVDIGRLLARLGELRLTGAVGPRAAALLPAGRGARLEHHVRAWIDRRRRRAQIHAMVAWSMRRALEAAGIEVVALKGTDLSRRLYGEFGARPSADVDLLVRARDMHRSVEVLASFDYLTGADDDRPWRRELHLTLHNPASGMPPLELHWRVEWYCGSAFSGRALDRAVVGEDGVRRMQPVDELATLLLITARDGFAGLRLTADVATWWDRYGEDVPEASLEGVAGHHPGLARPLATAAVHAYRLVGLPAALLLDVARADDPRSRLALRLADPLMTVGGPSGAGPTLVDGLLSDGPAVRGWVRRRLAPPAGHVALTYGLEADGRLRIAWMTAAQPARVVARSLWPLAIACRRRA